jgi:geranylgeranyl diphosphate synthase type II
MSVISASTMPAQRICDMRERIESRLIELVAVEDKTASKLDAAIRQSLLSGGKRLRPLITVLTASSLGADESMALDPACAIEMVHTSSLILDDLPMMDDALLRRGQPCIHRVFGEDTATLAAIAMLTRAFGLLGEAPGLSDQQRLALVCMLSVAIGQNGLIAGQVSDLEGQDTLHSGEQIVQMYGQKTGALFVASAEAGARVAGCTDADLEAVRGFARNLGLSFQIQDDLLDTVSTEALAGKDVNQDVDKATIASVLGAERASRLALRFGEKAITSLDSMNSRAEHLVDFARTLLDVTPEYAGGAVRDGAGV